MDIKLFDSELKEKTRPPFFRAMYRKRTKRQAIRVWPHSEIFAGP